MSATRRAAETKTTVRNEGVEIIRRDDHVVEVLPPNPMTLLAVAATDALSVINTSSIKYSQAPSSISTCITLTEPTVASTWSADNTLLFVASAQAVHQYNPSTNALKEVLRLPEGQTISKLICKDKNTLIYAVAREIHTWDPASTSKIASHNSPITSLSLSNDFNLLASTSSDGVHVHNLAFGSHTVLRGLLTTSTISASAFHPHICTRLLLGLAKQLLVYDTTRPLSPLKAIPLGDPTATAGDIIAVACSPFSKTLVAVATAGGTVGTLDLEKEKAYADRNF